MLRKADQNVRQPLVSLLAAIGAGTLCLGIAAAPARAAEVDRPTWVRKVTGSLHSQIRLSPAVPVAERMRKVAIVGAHFDADGNLFATSLDAPTGNRVLDDEALRAVNHTVFPRLPADMRGHARMVPIEVFFVTASDVRDREGARRRALALAAGARRFYAEVPAGRPAS